MAVRCSSRSMPVCAPGHRRSASPLLAPRRLIFCEADSLASSNPKPSWICFLRADDKIRVPFCREPLFIAHRLCIRQWTKLVAPDIIPISVDFFSNLHPDVQPDNADQPASKDSVLNDATEEHPIRLAITVGVSLQITTPLPSLWSAISWTKRMISDGVCTPGITSSRCR